MSVEDNVQVPDYAAINFWGTANIPAMPATIGTASLPVAPGVTAATVNARGCTVGRNGAGDYTVVLDPNLPFAAAVETLIRAAVAANSDNSLNITIENVAGQPTQKRVRLARTDTGALTDPVQGFISIIFARALAFTTF